MIPAGGYTGCGNDLYVLATNIGSGSVTSSPPDQPLTQPINTTTGMYELQVKSVYTIEPQISLAALPLLGNIPGLGQAVTLNITANRPVEHPGGLQVASGGSASNGNVTPFPRVASNPATTVPPTNTTWRTPNIFQQIQNAGQTVVSINVFVVQGNNPNFTPAGVTITPGEKIWIDTQAIGVWNPEPENGTVDCDANGYPSIPTGAGYTCSNCTPGSLNGPWEQVVRPLF